jgi:hypothetical protein
MPIVRNRIVTLNFILLITTKITALLTKSCEMSFFAKLEARVKAINSLLCVGLDPHEKELFPLGTEGVTEEQKSAAAYKFCKKLIDATGETTN